ncbi:MAG: PPC domain-containing DNA-binding protein [Candidatus Njordarchaeota archaeon]
MKVLDQGDKILIIMESGDLITKNLTELAKKTSISGFFVGLGAVKKPTIGFFDLNQKRYIRFTLNGEFEVVSFIGNISYDKENNPIVHAHICLGDKDYRIFGGHLFEAEVSVTLEILLIKTDRIIRKIDDRFDLKLIDRIEPQ